MLRTVIGVVLMVLVIGGLWFAASNQSTATTPVGPATACACGDCVEGCKCCSDPEVSCEDCACSVCECSGCETVTKTAVSGLAHESCCAKPAAEQPATVAAAAEPATGCACGDCVEGCNCCSSDEVACEDCACDVCECSGCEK